MNEVILTPEVIVGTLTIIGLTVVTLKKYGLLTIGRVPERRDCAKKCSDHEKVVTDAALAVREAKLTSEKLNGDIVELKESIKEIKDTLEHRQLESQAEFRRIREMLGSLSGYVKGLHERSVE